MSKENCSVAKFDPTKPVQTRDGRKARIICTDRQYVSESSGEQWPIVALVDFKGDGKEIFYSFRADGTAPHMAKKDALINIPDIKKQYRLLTPSGTTSVWCTYSLERAKEMLGKTQDRGNLIGISETVYIDGKITAINFIPREE